MTAEKIECVFEGVRDVSGVPHVFANGSPLPHVRGGDPGRFEWLLHPLGVEDLALSILSHTIRSRRTGDNGSDQELLWRKHAQDFAWRVLLRLPSNAWKITVTDKLYYHLESSIGVFWQMPSE